MKLKELSKVELEAMSYDDIAYMVLKESGKKIKINLLFSKICKLLDLPEKEYEDKIADFFELLSTDKRFVLLEKGYWDLRDNHSVKKIVVDEDEEEIVVEPDDEADISDEEESTEDDLFYEADETDDDSDDDLKDLVIIDEDETDGII